MALASSLHIGRSALHASQIGLQVTGNNFANAATPGYSRQIFNTQSVAEARFGSIGIGRGVRADGVRRQIDQALVARLQDGVSRAAAAGVELSMLSSVETTLNELSDNDLSSELSRFFNVWSDLANNPTGESVRSLVIQQGRTLAAHVTTLRRDLTAQRTLIDGQLEVNVMRADQLLTEIADINVAILEAEGGQTTANTLRDQRDQLVRELSEFVEVSTVEQPSGTLDVLVGSTPIVLNGLSRGLELSIESNTDELRVALQVRQDGSELNVRSGRIGGLLAMRGELVDDAINRLDDIASQLIFEVNRIHSTGYGATPMTTLTGTKTVASADQLLALNDPANSSFAALPFAPRNGGFVIEVLNEQTGTLQIVRLDVDLDGLDSAGDAGSADDSSVVSITADLDAIDNISASVNPDGTIAIESAPGFAFRFTEDSSDVLAFLGLNTYFTGSNGADIAVRTELQESGALLNAGNFSDGVPSDSGAALSIALLQDQQNTALGGVTVRGAWLDTVQSVAVRADAATTRAGAADLVLANLDAQRAAVSGVSLDEEAINLITYQQQFQGAARFLTVVDTLTQELLSIV